MSKRVLVWRGGTGIGDALMMTPAIRLLAEQGHEVYVVSRGPVKDIFENNPHVAGFADAPEDFASQEDYDAWQEECFKNYERIVPLAWTVEKAYLHRTDGYFGDIPSLEERRRAAAGHNYYDRNLVAAKLLPRPVLPELYPTEIEQESLRRLAVEKEQLGYKVVLWNTMGSTMNKFLSPVGFWIKALCEQVKDVRHYLLNAYPVAIPSIPQDNPNIIEASGVWNLRMSMLMTSIADLVIGPESAMVNAAGCFATPKIILYSHSSPDNLGRYYLNHFPIVPKCECHPCYLIPINFRALWHHKARALSRQFETECAFRSPLYLHRVLGYKCVMTLNREEIIETAASILRHGVAQQDHSLLSN